MNHCQIQLRGFPLNVESICQMVLFVNGGSKKYERCLYYFPMTARNTMLNRIAKKVALVIESGEVIFRMFKLP